MQKNTQVCQFNGDRNKYRFFNTLIAHVFANLH